jgi:hypothetical protein
MFIVAAAGAFIQPGPACFARRSSGGASERVMKTWRKPLLILSLCLGLSTVATVPFFFLAEPAEDDSRWALHLPETFDLYYHVKEAEYFYEGLKTGCVYPIWLVGANKGYGAPVTAYYPPGTYYLLSGFYLLLKDWTQATLGIYLTMMIGSAAAMYFYAKQSLSRTGAIVAMIAYIVMPFHLYEQYVRGTFGELMTYVWMPLILLFTDRLFRPGIASNTLFKFRSASRGGPPWPPPGPQEDASVPEGFVGGNSKPGGILLSIAGLAVCYGASLWSHVPSVHHFSLALGIYILLLGLVNRDWKGVVFCGVGIALALGLSAAYWYPAFVGRNLIWPGFIDPDVYHAAYVFSPDFYCDAYIWVFDLLAILGCTTVLLLATRRLQGNSASLRKQILPWVIMGGFAAFMTTSYSYQIGRRIPMISIAHRPFRMLMITTLTAALLIGACGHVASIAKSSGAKARYLLAGIGAALLIITVAFTAIRVVGPVHSASAENLSEIAPRSAFDPDPEDYNLVTPTTVAVVPNPNYDELLENLPLSEPAKLVNGRGQITIDKWDPQHRELSVELTEPDGLSIRTFNFPGWTATVDAHQARLGTGAELGEMFLDLQAGSHAITLDFLETPVRRRGKLLNLAALIAVSGIVCVASALRRRNRSAGQRERSADMSGRGSGKPPV